MLDCGVQKKYNDGMKNFFSAPRDSIYYLREKSDPQIEVLGYHRVSPSESLKYFRKQDFFTLHFVLRGKGKLFVNDVERDVGENCVFILGDEDEFMYYPDENDPWEYVYFCVKGEYLPAAAKKCGITASAPLKVCQSPESVKGMLTRLWQKREESGDVSYSAAMSALFFILDSLLDHTAKAQPARDKIDEIKAYIDYNFTRPDFSVESLCRQTCVSHTHLSRIFRAATGTTVNEYVARKRFSLAASLLTTTTKSVGEIAEIAGFEDYEYFFRFFRKRSGSTPLSYRKSHK